MGIATGENFPDALGGGALCGSRGGGLLLTRRTGMGVGARAALQDNASLLWQVRVFGAGGAVSDGVLSDARGRIALASVMRSAALAGGRPELFLAPGSSLPSAETYAR
jgi:hypothetical protein